MQQKLFYEPRSGKFVCQLLGVVISTYDFPFGRSGDRWKALTKKNNSEKVLSHAFIYGVP